MADAGTRDRILEAAQVLLKTRGAEALTVEAAADLARVSRKTVYNHFKNRYDLVDAAVARWMKTTISAVAGAAGNGELPFIERLNAVVERGFRELREGGRILGRPRRETLDSSEAALMEDIKNSMLSLIQNMMEDSARAGFLQSGLDPRRMSLVVLNIIAGLTVLEDGEDDGITRAELLQDSLRAVVSGILSPLGREAMRGSPLLVSEA